MGEEEAEEWSGDGDKGGETVGGCAACQQAIGVEAEERTVGVGDDGVDGVEEICGADGVEYED